ncbi:MAG: SAF domain-containing protein [Marmoricola sp.]
MDTPSLLAAPRRYRRLWRRLLWHRRKVAALLAAVAVFAILNVLKPPPVPSVTVLTARHDLTAGTRLRAADVVAVRYPATLAPARALRTPAAVVGRIVTSALASGTPMTSFSLGGVAWSGLAPGHQAVPARLQDSTVAELLSPGQHVRLAAVDPRSPTEAQTLVEDAIVLATPTPERGSTSTTTGRLVVFDVPASRANLVTSSAVSRYLTVTWGY